MSESGLSFTLVETGVIVVKREYGICIGHLRLRYQLVEGSYMPKVWHFESQHFFLSHDELIAIANELAKQPLFRGEEQ